MGGRLSMPKGADGMSEVSKPTTPPRLTRGRGIINGRTIMAPLAAFTMAGLLFFYSRVSIRAAKLNAKKHREADGGQISWQKESLRMHGQLEKVEDNRGHFSFSLLALTTSMKGASPDSNSLINRIRSWTGTKAHGNSSLSAVPSRPSLLPLSKATTTTTSATSSGSNNGPGNQPPNAPIAANGHLEPSSNPTANHVADNISSDSPPPAPPPQADGEGAVIENPDDKPKKAPVMTRFYRVTKHILLSSYVNILLVFVPVGIASRAANMNPTIVFVMNAIAIVPLAGLLSHATESVAKRMGDAVGALMNISFGNGPELIIFIIALKEDQIRIVQASLLGSILANLLLILGMCFLIGGLRFREQIYNSTVTQMSACLLSLAVMSLLLPTAFHAAFTSSTTAQVQFADDRTLQVSRGTSIVLLVVYIMYLLFQLKSHAYMYESTPQHIIDEESAPGPVAAWMDSSTSDSDTSSSSSSDESDRSNTTASRIRRVMRGGRKRKSSAASTITEGITIGPHVSTNNSHNGEGSSITSPTAPQGYFSRRFSTIDHGEDGDDETTHTRRSSHAASDDTREHKPKKRRRHRRRHRHHRKKRTTSDPEKAADGQVVDEKQGDDPNAPKRVDFAIAQDLEAQTEELALKRPFTLRSIRPPIPKTLSQSIFMQPPPRGPHPAAETPAVTGPIPHVRYGIRRTNSLPEWSALHRTVSGPRGIPPLSARQPSGVPSAEDHKDDDEMISRTSAVVLLLISTGLVAACAEFMVSSISSVTTNTALGETFVGLILLPIIGNAAEHVTAVTVAAKNKVDLAIGVAVGSSIQIALFVTPFMIILGWILNKPLSLFFTLFETVSLFVSVFVVNFLVLDGRSNYLEGALLCCSYLIIAVAAFFYPPLANQSVLGGNPGALPSTG